MTEGASPTHRCHSEAVGEESQHENTLLHKILRVQPPATSNKKKRPLGPFIFWSGRRDLNPRHQPWQGCALPLSYTRIFLE